MKKLCRPNHYSLFLMKNVSAKFGCVPLCSHTKDSAEQLSKAIFLYHYKARLQWNVTLIQSISSHCCNALFTPWKCRFFYLSRNEKLVNFQETYKELQRNKKFQNYLIAARFKTAKVNFMPTEPFCQNLIHQCCIGKCIYLKNHIIQKQDQLFFSSNFEIFLFFLHLFSNIFPTSRIL